MKINPTKRIEEEYSKFYNNELYAKLNEYDNIFNTILSFQELNRQKGYKPNKLFFDLQKKYNLEQLSENKSLNDIYKIILNANDTNKAYEIFKDEYRQNFAISYDINEIFSQLSIEFYHFLKKDNLNEVENHTSILKTDFETKIIERKEIYKIFIEEIPEQIVLEALNYRFEVTPYNILSKEKRDFLRKKLLKSIEIEGIKKPRSIPYYVKKTNELNKQFKTGVNVKNYDKFYLADTLPKFYFMGDESHIAAIGETFLIKEELRKLGFKWKPNNNNGHWELKL